MKMSATSPPNARPEQWLRGTDGRRRNNLQHGLRSSLGSLPKGASYVARELKRLRLLLEAAVLAAKGKVSIDDSSAINAGR